MIHSSEDEFDRLLREVMQSSPEHPRIANLAARAVQRARAFEGASVPAIAVRLARHSLIDHVLAAFTAVAMIALVLFTVDRLFLSGMFGVTDVVLPVADSDLDASDISQVLQSEQTVAIASGTFAVLLFFLVVYSSLPGPPPTVSDRKRGHH